MAGSTPGPIGLTSHPVIDWGRSTRTESYPPGPLVGGQPPSHRDELTPIARYIAAEMNANAHGETVKRIAELHAFSADACIADFSKLPLWRQILGAGIGPDQCVEMQISYRTAALITWALKVRQNGDWDHKPRIAASFHPASQRETSIGIYTAVFSTITKFGPICITGTSARQRAFLKPCCSMEPAWNKSART